jgi:hypothetical protein
VLDPPEEPQPAISAAVQSMTSMRPRRARWGDLVEWKYLKFITVRQRNA